MANESRTAPSGDHSATHYVVELGENESKRYAICERLLTVAPHETVDGMSGQMLERLFSGDTLRALPIPTADDGQGSRHWGEMAARLQSGTGPHMRVTINNFAGGGEVDK